jgi:hypothetical protein
MIPTRFLRTTAFREECALLYRHNRRIFLPFTDLDFRQENTAYSVLSDISACVISVSGVTTGFGRFALGGKR